MAFCREWEDRDAFKAYVKEVLRQDAQTRSFRGLSRQQYTKEMKKKVYAQIREDYKFDPITWIFIVIKIYQVVRLLIDYFYTEATGKIND